jgi:hypothetical protein
MIKDQTAELRDEMKMWMGIMVTINLSVLAFSWQIVRDGKLKAS